MTTIRIGCPYYSTIESQVRDFVGRLYASKKYHIIPEDRNCFARGTVQALNRNRTVSASQLIRQTEFDFDYYLSIDSDTWWAGGADDLLDRLIAHDVPVVGAAYPYRDPAMAGHYVAWMWDGFVGNVKPISIADTCGLIRVDGVGHGCCLHKVGVFRALPYPWYRNPIITDGDYADMADESVGLAMLCREHGISIYCDTNTVCKHISTQSPHCTLW